MRSRVPCRRSIFFRTTRDSYYRSRMRPLSTNWPVGEPKPRASASLVTSGEAHSTFRHALRAYGPKIDVPAVKLASVEAIVRALNENRVAFIVVGGLAVVAHGYGRLTQDLDLVVRLESENVRRAFETLSGLGYRPRVPVTAEGLGDAAQRARWISEKGMTVLNFHSDRHRETPIDVFVVEPFDFVEEHRHARVAEIAPGAEVRIVRLETLIRMKERAGRPQDLADVAELRALDKGGERE